MLARMGIASDPVLRPEKSHQLHVRGVEQHVYRGVEIPVHSGRIGHESYPLSPYLLETVLFQHVYARPHLLRSKISLNCGK